MFWRYNYQGILWALFILVLCGLPGDQFAKSKLQNTDAAIHLILYGILFFLLAVGFIKQTTYRQLRKNTLRKVFAISVIYGVIVELLQATVFIGRSIEISDMLFNTLGAFLGMLLFLAIYGRKSYL